MADRSADLLIVAIAIGVLIGLVILCIVAQRRERRRRAAWHRAYFRRGGLAWTLVRRWSRTPRLTDQRPDR